MMKERFGTAEWVLNDNNEYVCSQCEAKKDLQYYIDFCGNCGAMMMNVDELNEEMEEN